MIVVGLDLTDYDHGVAAVRERARDLRPVFKSLRKEIRADLEDHFNNAESPETHWPSWARSTQERFLGLKGNTYKRGKRRGDLTARGGRRIRNMLGRLKSAHVFSLRPQVIDVMSRVAWAGVHQHGGRGGRGLIPQRQHIWFTDDFADRFARRVHEYVLEGW